MELTCTILLRPNPIPSASASSSSFYYRGYPLAPSGDDDLQLLEYVAVPAPVQSVPVSLSSAVSTLALKCWLVVDLALLPPAPIPVQTPILLLPDLDLCNSKARVVEAVAAVQEIWLLWMFW